MTFPAIYGAVSTLERDIGSMLLEHSHGIEPSASPQLIGERGGCSLSEPRLHGGTGVGRTYSWLSQKPTATSCRVSRARQRLVTLRMLEGR
jgi:hypothetical protein